MTWLKDRVTSDKNISKDGDSDPSGSTVPSDKKEINQGAFDEFLRQIFDLNYNHLKYIFE